MSKHIGLAALLLVASVGTAFAGDFGHHLHWWNCPEIDPASALSGLTMLAGTLAVLRGRRAPR